MELKTEYKHIYFVKDEEEVDIWWCYHNKTEERLGMIDQHKKWGKCIFHPEHGTFFTGDCHRDIADFQGQLDGVA